MPLRPGGPPVRPHGEPSSGPVPSRPTPAPHPPPAPPTPPPPKPKKVRKPGSATPPAFVQPELVNSLVVAYNDSLRPPPVAPIPGGPRKKAPQLTYEYAMPDAAKPEIVQCTITLPAESRLQTKVFVSPPAERVAARTLAATEVMHELWRAGEVGDDYLAEAADSDKSPGSDARQPPGMQKINASSYPVKTPAFWDACEAELAKGLVGDGRTWYPTLVTLPPLPADPAEPDAPPPMPLRPLLLVMPVPLPTFSGATPLQLFPPNSTTARPVKMSALPPLRLSMAEHAMADHYTRRLLRSIMNRPYVLEEGKMLIHLILPPSAALDSVDWDEVLEAQGEPYERWQWQDVDALERQAKDAMTTGKNEFSRRHAVKAVRRDLSPLSSPDDSPREKGYASILDYIKSTSGKFGGLLGEGQPLIEMKRLPMVKSHLRSIVRSEPDPPTTEGAEPRRMQHEQKYIIPELSYRSTLHLSTYRSALYLPSLFIRLSTLFQIYELKASLIGSTIREDVLLQALTTPAAGLEEDYEELEFAGDVVLKTIVSCYLFAMFPQASESDLTARRVSLVNNKFLHTKLIESGLTGCVQAKDHSPKDWYPLNMGRLDDPGPSKSNNSMLDAVLNAKHIVLGDKVCADIVEALICAAFKTGGLAAAWTFCRTIKLPMPEIAAWTDFANVKLPPSEVAADLCTRDAARDVQDQLLKYRFEDVGLLHQVLKTDRQDTFERLEYLGDAMLDFFSINYLLERMPHASIGELVLYKSSMVSNVALSALCVEIGLHRIVPSKTVKRYEREVIAARDREHQAAAAEGRALKVYWTDLDAPKVLGDLIEALIGALMVDGRFSTIEPRKFFFDTHCKPFFDKYIQGLHSLPIQPAHILSQIVTRRRCKGMLIRKGHVATPSHTYRQLEKTDVLVHKRLLGTATAETDNFAMRQACASALTAIEADPGLLARLCDCQR